VRAKGENTHEPRTAGRQSAGERKPRTAALVRVKLCSDAVVEADSRLQLVDNRGCPSDGSRQPFVSAVETSDYDFEEEDQEQ